MSLYFWKSYQQKIFLRTSPIDRPEKQWQYAQEKIIMLFSSYLASSLTRDNNKQPMFNEVVHEKYVCVDYETEEKQFIIWKVLQKTMHILLPLQGCTEEQRAQLPHMKQLA